MITGNESFTSLWRNFGPLFFAEVFWVRLDGFWAWLCLQSCHCISVWFKSRQIRPIPNLHSVFVFFCLFCCFLLSHLESLTSWLLDIPLHNFLTESRIHGKSSRPWHSKAQTITLPPPCLFTGMMLFFWKSVLQYGQTAKLMLDGGGVWRFCLTVHHFHKIKVKTNTAAWWNYRTRGICCLL